MGHQTTHEAKQALKSKWYYQACQKDITSSAWKNSAFPYTDACIFTAVDLYTLRHFKWTANFQSLEPWMIAAYRKAETLLKTGLFPFWRIEFDNHLSSQTDFLYSTKDVDRYTPVVVVEQVSHPQEEVFDLTVQTNLEKNVFKGVDARLFNWESEPSAFFRDTFTPFMKSSHISTFGAVLKTNKVIASCQATTETVQTFDNVTYPYDMHNCWTLVSSHCAPNPTYAVFMKKSARFAKDFYPKMDVEVHIGGHETYYWPTNQKLGRSDTVPTNYKIKIHRQQK